MFSVSYYGGNGLIFGLEGRAVLSVGSSRQRLLNKEVRGTAMASLAALPSIDAQ